MSILIRFHFTTMDGGRIIRLIKIASCFVNGNDLFLVKIDGGKHE